ncbi:hypothetical protein GCM10009740_16580 [Terrabacter terrae]|uniref:Secreted protein n=1 Tax=Terrabacter terrae TaxID=318434 RepID=A0ABN2U487_9MICO
MLLLFFGVVATLVVCPDASTAAPMTAGTLWRANEAASVVSVDTMVVSSRKRVSRPVGRACSGRAW